MGMRDGELLTAAVWGLIWGTFELSGIFGEFYFLGCVGTSESVRAWFICFSIVIVIIVGTFCHFFVW